MSEEGVADDYRTDVDFIDEDVEFRAKTHLELVGDESDSLGLSEGHHVLCVGRSSTELSVAFVVASLVVASLVVTSLVVAVLVLIPVLLAWVLVAVVLLVSLGVVVEAPLSPVIVVVWLHVTEILVALSSS